MSNMYIEVMDRNNIKNHQMEILSNKGIRLFLPATFMEDEYGNIISYVDGEGYVKLNQIGHIGQVKAIDMIGMLVDGMRDASNNYVFPEEYEVSEKTLFVNRDLSTLRIMFKPSKENERLKEERREIRGGEIRSGDMEVMAIGSKEGFPKLMYPYQREGLEEGETIEIREIREAGEIGVSGRLREDLDLPKGAPPDPPQHIYRRVRALADLLSVRVGEDAAGPVWEAARLFRADGFGPAVALRELAKLRHRVWIKESAGKQDDADNYWE